LYVCLFIILSNKLDLNQETRFTIIKLKMSWALLTTLQFLLNL
jgi:hypothetical protein